MFYQGTQETEVMSMNHDIPPILKPDDLLFPDVLIAQQRRDGLVAVGGDLSAKRLLYAYEQGILKPLKNPT